MQKGENRDLGLCLSRKVGSSDTSGPSSKLIAVDRGLRDLRSMWQLRSPLFPGSSGDLIALAEQADLNHT